MAQTEDMIECIHKETGKKKWLPKNIFNDKAIAERLDYVPLEIKKFEGEQPVSEGEISPQLLAREKAKQMEIELAEKKRQFNLENTGEITTDPLADTRHHSVIIKEIKASSDKSFVAQYLNDERKSIRQTAEEKINTLN